VRDAEVPILRGSARQDRVEVLRSRGVLSVADRALDPSSPLAVREERIRGRPLSQRDAQRSSHAAGRCFFDVSGKASGEARWIDLTWEVGDTAALDRAARGFAGCLRLAREHVGKRSLTDGALFRTGDHERGNPSRRQVRYERADAVPRDSNRRTESFCSD
jgi:hypothetical protein